MYRLSRLYKGVGFSSVVGETCLYRIMKKEFASWNWVVKVFPGEKYKNAQRHVTV